MSMFDYEIQDTRRYLVYKKSIDDTIDTVAMEMMQSNRIEGLLPFMSVQVDDVIYMKYDITGMSNLKEYLSGIVSRNKVLSVLESMLDAILVSDDYLINVNSYVLDTSYIYVDPALKKTNMILLPVEREETSIEVFLRKLFFEIQFDQSEDCSYVAALINFLGDSKSFSIQKFKEQIKRYNGVKIREKKVEVPPISADIKEAPQPNIVKEEPKSIKHSRPFPSMTREQLLQELEKKKNLDILFEHEGLEKKKENKGLFMKKDSDTEEEKKEKSKWPIFGKKRKKEKQSADNSGGALLDIAIPGQDLFQGIKNEKNGSVSDQPVKKEIAVPARKVKIEQYQVDEEEFGATVNMGEGEEPTVTIAHKRQSLDKFVLYRCRTGESFKIHDEITRIGRNPKITEICITENKGIGRLHAILYMIDGEVFIRDNNSQNGTYVNDKQILPNMEPYQLPHNSKIYLGDEEFEFRINI